MPSDITTERLDGWTGVITGADPDVIPGDVAPFGANAAITHHTIGGAVERRKGAITDGVITSEPVVLGIFGYPGQGLNTRLIVVTADGKVSTVDE